MRPLEDTAAAWVPSYFGEDYLRLYQFPPERTEPEIAFLRACLTSRVPPGARVLELACGQGRHAVPLANAGWRVVGVDYQRNLLAAAARLAQEQAADLSLVCGDMRRLPFHAAFAAVTCLFSAFGYFEDAENAQVLTEIARVLAPGGWLVLDVANRDALLRTAVPRSWKRLPDGTLVVSEWTWDVPSGRYTHWQLLVDAAGSRTYSHSVRVYTCTELTALLAQAGLHVEALYGGFCGEALTWEAPRLIVLARKAAQ